MGGSHQGDRGDGTEGGEEGKGEERGEDEGKLLQTKDIEGSMRGPRGPKKIFRPKIIV